MEEYHRYFMSNIRHLRRVHSLSQAQMAEILGIGTQTLQKIEKNGAGRITSQMLCRVCDHFGLSADAILLENWDTHSDCGTSN